MALFPSATIAEGKMALEKKLMKKSRRVSNNAEAEILWCNS
jgi:hypothetical protein